MLEWANVKVIGALWNVLVPQKRSERADHKHNVLEKFIWDIS